LTNYEVALSVRKAIVLKLIIRKDWSDLATTITVQDMPVTPHNKEFNLRPLSMVAMTFP